jgi:uncharacterized protein DUF4357
MNSKGRTIRLFLVDGSPSSILTAEIMNWTGHVLYGPRTRIADLLKRDEVKRTGLYLLVGQSPDNPLQSVVYIGESDNVRQRLLQHNIDESKDFWDFVCVITSKDQNLTKAHVRYLESRLIDLVKDEGRAELRNVTNPDFGYLPEADIADMNYFSEQLRVLLPSIGLEFLRPTPTVSRNSAAETSTAATDDSDAAPSSSNTTSSDQRQLFGQARPTAEGGSSPEFHIEVRKPPLKASAVELDGRMIVLEGSEARADEQPSLLGSVSSYRSQLLSSGKLVPTDRQGVLRFVDDVAFTSPSAASQAVHGTSRNGRTDWINSETNETYADWQEAQLSDIGSE